MSNRIPLEQLKRQVADFSREAQDELIRYIYEQRTVDQGDYWIEKDSPTEIIIHTPNGSLRIPKQPG